MVYGTGTMKIQKTFCILLTYSYLCIDKLKKYRIWELSDRLLLDVSLALLLAS